jgi:hypothetical protein
MAGLNSSAGCKAEALWGSGRNSPGWGERAAGFSAEDLRAADAWADDLCAGDAYAAYPRAEDSRAGGHSGAELRTAWFAPGSLVASYQAAFLWPVDLPSAKDFVRCLALALGLYWSLRGLRRLWVEVQRYDRSAQQHGLRAGLVQRCAWRIALRSTLLDPLNLLLLLLLLAINFPPGSL